MFTSMPWDIVEGMPCLQARYVLSGCVSSNGAESGCCEGTEDYLVGREASVVGDVFGVAEVDEEQYMVGVRGDGGASPAIL